MHCVAGAPASATLSIQGAAWREELAIAGEGREVTRELVLPPGETRVCFACDGEPVHAPGDPRTMIFRVENFSVRRLEALPSPAAVARQGADEDRTRRE
jgi:hypothetical protein